CVVSKLSGRSLFRGQGVSGDVFAPTWYYICTWDKGRGQP
ncbi:hypothetical protein M513_13961, partial [Trichuris suis]